MEYSPLKLPLVPIGVPVTEDFRGSDRMIWLRNVLLVEIAVLAREVHNRTRPSPRVPAEYRGCPLGINCLTTEEDLRAAGEEDAAKDCAESRGDID
jgi:hypothetical protein